MSAAVQMVLLANRICSIRSTPASPRKKSVTMIESPVATRINRSRGWPSTLERDIGRLDRGVEGDGVHAAIRVCDDVMARSLPRRHTCRCPHHRATGHCLRARRTLFPALPTSQSLPALPVALRSAAPARTSMSTFAVSAKLTESSARRRTLRPRAARDGVRRVVDLVHVIAQATRHRICAQPPSTRLS